jgi:fimbrial chaperone protein
MFRATARRLAYACTCISIAMAPLMPAMAGSLSVEPLFIELVPGASGAVRVRNTSDEPMTVELSVTERSVDAVGKQTRADADDAFILFPPQGIIAPQQVQVFRIQPLTPDPAKSRSYFLTVKQLPVKLDPIEGGGTRLQVVFAFDVAVHAVPRGAKSNMQFISSALDTMQVEKAPPADAPPLAPDAKRPKPEMETIPAIAVTLRNDGSKYLYLQDYEYMAAGVDEAGAKVEIPAWDPNAIIDAAKVSLVQPGAERTFKLPLRDLPKLKSVELRVRQRAGS